MASATDALETLILNHIFRTNTWAKPTALTLGLHSAAPDEDASPTNELSGGGYAQVALGAPADASWSAPTDDGTGKMVTDNVAAATFPEATADWAAATHYSIWADGVMWIAAALTTPKTILDGETARFAAGTLDVKAS
jgi:hypothetical protein